MSSFNLWKMPFAFQCKILSWLVIEKKAEFEKMKNFIVDDIRTLGSSIIEMIDNNSVSKLMIWVLLVFGLDLVALA